MNGAAAAVGLLAGMGASNGRHGVKGENVEDDSEESDKDSNNAGIIDLNCTEQQKDAYEETESVVKVQINLDQVDTRNDENDEAETSTANLAAANLEQVLRISELGEGLSSACEELTGEVEAEKECADGVSSRQARRMQRKTVKAERRAQRECASAAVDAKRKPCEVCGRLVDLLVRCTHDSSQKWCMLCGRCWKTASGGITDGDADHPHYRYGGLWKNRSADLSMPTFSGKP